METYDYQSLWRQVNGLQAWQIIALGAVGAEKVAPIIRFLALPDTWSLAEICIETSWSAALEPDSEREKCARLAQALGSVPEWTCEYPDTVIFNVARVLGFVQGALATVTSPSISEKAKYVSFSLMLEVAETFDLSMDRYPELLSSDHRIVPEEKKSQQWLIQQFKEQDRPSPEIIRSLRQETRRISDLFENALPTFCYEFASSLIRVSRLREASRAEKTGRPTTDR